MPKINKKLQTSTFDREQIFSTTDVEEKTHHQDLVTFVTSHEQAAEAGLWVKRGGDKFEG